MQFSIMVTPIKAQKMSCSSWIFIYALPLVLLLFLVILIFTVQGVVGIGRHSVGCHADWNYSLLWYSQN